MEEMAAPASIPAGSRVIQSVGSHLSSVSRGQQGYTVLQATSMPLGQHQLPVQTIAQNGKHILPTATISPNTYGGYIIDRIMRNHAYSSLLKLTLLTLKCYI